VRDLARAQAQLKRWREDPLSFVVECLGVEPDAWQVDVLRAFPHNQRLAMKACKGPGKTAMLSWLCWNFLATRSHPKIAATSITADNLRDNLWTEMAHWQHRSPFLKAAFMWNAERITAKDHPETWWMSARTWSKSADTGQQANTLAGLHAENLMFVMDEVGGIPDSVAAAAEAGLANDHTGKNSKIVVAGNPTHLEGPLYRACTNERHLWWVVEITSDPDDPKRTPRVSVQWAREQIEKYGRDNPWVLVNVFGQFPPSSMNTLLGPDEVSAAMNRRPKFEHYEFSQKRLGIDVARFGDDRTIIFPRQGLMAFKPAEMRGARTHEIAARVAQAKSKWNSELELIDDTGGFGGGVIDSLLQAGIPAMGIHFAGKAIDPRYLNKRAEMWFQMAEWVKRGGSLPKIPELTRELTAPTYTFQNGKFRLEEKQQIKERLGYSPDMADALCLTFALPDQPTNLGVLGFQKHGKMLAEYDPFDESRT
jgi:phage terminase large subunit